MSHGCHIFAFRFNLPRKDVLQNALTDFLNEGVEFARDNRGFELEYASEIPLLDDSPHVIQLVMNRLGVDVLDTGRDLLLQRYFPKTGRSLYLYSSFVMIN